MALRITDFVKLDGKDIGLYIMQEPNLICFRIQVFFAGKMVVMLLCKSGAKWENTSKDTPKWADALIPGLINTISKRFFVELN